MTRLYLLLLTTLVWSCRSNSESHTETTTEETENVLVVKDILATNNAVKIGAIQQQLVEKKVICTGSIITPPTALISIHSKSDGIIEGMHFLPGDFVKKGELLLTISNAALVEKQRILLETKAALSLAEKEYNRKSTLQAENATTQKSFDEALAQKESLAATYLGLKNELSLMGINIASLEQEQKFQSKLSIYAPQNGYIQEVLVNQGQMITPQNKLLSIADKDQAILELEVLSKDVAFLKVGQKVQFSLANNTQAFTATIKQLNPVLNQQKGSLSVYCKLDAPQQFIKAGMFVNASVEVEAHHAQGIPLEAVIKEGENYFAYFVEGKFLQKQVLKNAQVINNFVTFDNEAKGELVVAGAYYIE